MDRLAHPFAHGAAPRPRLTTWALPVLASAWLLACVVPPSGAAVPMPSDPLLRAAVEAARTDLAPRAGVPAAQVQLVRAERVTWPDGSLGCPQPGVLYTQALVPGVRVVLRAAGKDWAYHGPERGGVSWCAGAATGPAGPGAALPQK